MEKKTIVRIARLIVVLVALLFGGWLGLTVALFIKGKILGGCISLGLFILGIAMMYIFGEQ